jgi:hypothetical protein
MATSTTGWYKFELRQSAVADGLGAPIETTDSGVLDPSIELWIPQNVQTGPWTLQVYRQTPGAMVGTRSWQNVAAMDPINTADNEITRELIGEQKTQALAWRLTSASVVLNGNDPWGYWRPTGGTR